MENRRIRFIKSKKKAIAHIKRLKKGSNERSLGKTHLRLLCQKLSHRSR